eukprot:m.10643 g.10643  ORF g.10643 m.10643 type:complete len:431 (-) comp4300_c0_seq1:304-1596(-)
MAEKLADLVLRDRTKIEEFRKLVKELNSDGMRQETQKIEPQKLLDLLGTFKVEQHSLGWLELLYIMKDKRNLQVNFLDAARHFLISCTEMQVALSVNKFCVVANAYAEQHARSGAPDLRAVEPLLAAVQKIQKTPQHLTAVHPSFLKTCILAKCYHIAERVLKTDALYLPGKEGSKDNSFTIESLLLWGYYGGIVYIALSDFDRALQFFSIVLTAPAETVSAIMFEAFKKYTLLCLLQKGEFINLPQYSSQRILQQIQMQCQSYQEFTKAHKKGVLEEAKLTVAKFHAEFTADGNMGLIKQCLAKITRQNIKKLTETFMTLSLSDIAEQVQLQDAKAAETALVGMIADGEIHATINQLTGTVSFHDDPEKYDSAETTERLQTFTKKAAEIYEIVKTLDKTVRCSPRYIKKMSPPTDGATGGVDMDSLSFT